MNRPRDVGVARMSYDFVKLQKSTYLDLGLLSNHNNSTKNYIKFLFFYFKNL